MASISRDKNGNRTIQVVCADGKRRSIRLGKMPKKAAEEIKTRVESLNSAAVSHTSPDRATAAWVGALIEKNAVLYDKLAAIGLLTKRAEAKQATSAAFVDGYLAKESDKKRSTIVCLTQCRNDLVEFFGADKPLADVTEGDAEDWQHWLRQKRISHPGRQKSPTARASKASYRDRDKPTQPPKRLQENTIRRRCGRARQLFQAAVRHRLIARNPFAELKGVSVLANRSRDYFVTRDDATKVFDACPDAQWRLLFALSRYGGLRCPSEHLGLRCRISTGNAAESL